MAEAKQRSRLLSARDAFVEKLAKETSACVLSYVRQKEKEYPALLKSLIKQAVLRLAGEQQCEVRCRAQDLAAAQAAVQSVVHDLQAGGKGQLQVTVVADSALASSAGGVVVTALGGRIKCNNTYEARTAAVLHDLTPVIRDVLFPSARADIKTKPPVYFPHMHQHSAPPAPAAAAPAKAAAAAAPAPAAPVLAGGGATATGESADPFAFNN